MKTPMQELIEIIKKRQEDDEAMPFMYNDRIIALAESLLDKEKEQRMEAWCSGYDSYDEDISGDSPLEYYNKTFNTKER